MAINDFNTQKLWWLSIMWAGGRYLLEEQRDYVFIIGDDGRQMSAFIRRVEWLGLVEMGLISIYQRPYYSLTPRGRYLVENRYWHMVKPDLIAAGYSFVEPQPHTANYYSALEAKEELLSEGRP